jgi:two-component system chemotaxis response regulator CheY
MSLRILVVDDSPAMRAHIRRVLTSSGLPIDALIDAGDGLEALERLKDSQVNLILSDINMPNMDGEELVRNIKADRTYREIPILVITTDNSTARVLRLRQLGAQGYICKPFTPDLVKQKVLAALGS